MRLTRQSKDFLNYPKNVLTNRTDRDIIIRSISGCGTAWYVREFLRNGFGTVVVGSNPGKRIEYRGVAQLGSALGSGANCRLRA